MVIMALDHTRDFFGQPGSPTNLATASAALFFTRWITHFCAPVFFLLIGTGAFLSLRKRSKSKLSRFLFTRGLWLIFLELVLFRCLALQFNFDYHITIINVLWALGWAMIVLSVLVHLPPSIVAAFGVVLIATHNLFDSINSSNPFWSILHSPNIIFSDSEPYRLSRLSPHPLGRSPRSRLRTRSDLLVGTRSPQGFSPAPWHRPYRHLRRD